MRNKKTGFYTVEAAIVLPLLILAIISVSYFIRIDSIWENCIYGAIDESSYAADLYSDKILRLNSKARIINRLKSDNPRLSYLEITHYLSGYTDGTANNLTSYTIHASSDLSLPLDFGRTFEFKTQIKYRGFVGLKEDTDGMGAEALETSELSEPVYIFPQYGKRYHGENCSYVKASVKPFILSSAIRTRYSSCNLCNSKDMDIGNLVFCFSSKDTAYHRGSCRSIKRHPIICNKSEAKERGYSPCTKCGGNTID